MVKVIDNILYVDNKPYKHGDEIFVSIKGIIGKGCINMSKYSSDNKIYICQNLKDGSEIKERFGYKYSWVFKIIDGYADQDVILYNDKPTKIVTIKDEGIISNQLNDDYSIKSSLRICNIKPHPDCCGAKILYGFNESYIKEDLINIYFKNFLHSIIASKIAHIAGYQTNAKNLLEKLGFKSIHSFKNKNGGNEITIYQLD